MDGGRGVRVIQDLRAILRNLRRGSAAAVARAALSLCALALPAALASAQGPQVNGPSGGGVQLTGMRVWPNPGGTRVVLAFNAPVTTVAPDSGRGPQLVVAVPMPGISAAPGVATSMAAGDTAISRVEALFDNNGVRFWLKLAPAVEFKVFTLPAE